LGSLLAGCAAHQNAEPVSAPSHAELGATVEPAGPTQAPDYTPPAVAPPPPEAPPPPPNMPPQISLLADAPTGPAPHLVNFTILGLDPEGDSFGWSFDADHLHFDDTSGQSTNYDNVNGTDGRFETGGTQRDLPFNFSVLYDHEGLFIAYLRAVDQSQNSVALTLQITIDDAPKEQSRDVIWEAAFAFRAGGDGGDCAGVALAGLGGAGLAYAALHPPVAAWNNPYAATFVSNSPMVSASVLIGSQEDRTEAPLPSGPDVSEMQYLEVTGTVPQDSGEADMVTCGGHDVQGEMMVYRADTYL
jgi:hypothetical protein